MKSNIALKDKEILRVRGDYFRLVEHFKGQVKERQVLIEKLTNEDAKAMKQMLQLRNKMIDAEKTTEKQVNEAQTDKETELQRARKLGQEKIGDNDVKIHELNENQLSMKQIERKKVIYELELFEWGKQCKDLQEEITRIKYENQIKMAEKKTEIEIKYDESLEKFKQQAQSDAQRSKSDNVYKLQTSTRLKRTFILRMQS